MESGKLGEHREIDVEVTYLEMRDPNQLNPAPRTDLVVMEAEVACPQLNRFFYTAVGGPWYWTDRLSWSHDVWQQYLQRNELQTWVGYVRGTPAGYYELEWQDGEVELCSFGLLPQFTGLGFGGDLLTRAVGHAWDMRPRRVWLHTCTLDSPRALANYHARGFRTFKTERIRERKPPEPGGPW